MTDKLPERQLRRLFPDAKESFIRANAISYHDTRVSDKPELLDQKSVAKTSGSEKAGEVDREVFVEFEFHAEHGQTLDDDNRKYILKPFFDALVNLGFSKTDRLFKGTVTQRTNKGDDHI